VAGKKEVVSHSVKEKYFLLSERKQGGGNNSRVGRKFLFMEPKFGMSLANTMSTI